MLTVSRKYESLDTIFEDEINEAQRIYSSNQAINDFIVSRNLPKIKDHLESAYDNADFVNAQAPWFLIFKNPSDDKKKGALMFTTSKNSNCPIKSVTKETVESMFGNGFDVDATFDTNGEVKYFTVTDREGKIIGGTESNNGKGEKIVFKFKGTNSTSAGGKFPSSTDMEMVISYAFNHRLFGDSEEGINENLDIVGVTRSRDKYEPYYKANEEWLAPLAEYIRRKLKVNGNVTLRKLANNEVTKSKDWRGSDNTPKTDIISNDGKIKISVKNAAGAQAMSGALDESRATIMNVLNHELKNLDKNKYLANKIKTALQLTVEDDEVLEDTVDRVLFSVKDVDDISPDSLGWTRSVKKSLLSSSNQQEIRKDIHAKLSKIFTSLLDVDDNFKKAIVRESLLGEIKFEGSDAAIPNYMLTWEIGKKTCDISDVDSYIDKVFKKVKGVINFKGSEEITYTALRLSLPKKYIDDAVNNATLNAEEELNKRAEQAIKNNSPAKKTSRRSNKKASVEM